MTTAADIQTTALYWFKLLFPDGRWSVQEKRLATPPQETDCVDLGDDGRWQICGQERVAVRPSGKPARDFFVCRPAA